MAVETEAQLWGGETVKAVENFPVSGQPVPPPVIHWLGRIKAAAARVNTELGKLDPAIAERIATAGDAVAAGEHDDQFPVDVFQTGSGTSSNMNANEVIASLAGDEAHPNDHVNMGQSSNDVFPSAVHLAALGEANEDLLPALDGLADALASKAEEFASHVRLGAERVRGTLGRVGQIPLGGTATGTGINTHAEFAQRVRQKLAEATGLEISAPFDRFEAQANRDALVELSGALKVVAVSLIKIANDLALMGSGPRAGLAEIRLPELQKGSSIMPGKVNPVLPEVAIQVGDQVIGNDAAITAAGSQGQFELNVRVPLIARNLLDSIKLLASACRLLDIKCVRGIEPHEDMLRHHAESTLQVATALNPHIGYDKAAEIVKEAATTHRTVREVAREKGVDEAVLDEALDYVKMARPHG
jgi:fumarate hydratase class II